MNKPQTPDIEFYRMKKVIAEALPVGSGDYTVTVVTQAALKEARAYRELLKQTEKSGV